MSRGIEVFMPLILNSESAFTSLNLEARVYAEDPNTMLPSPGIITWLEFPRNEYVRIDHALAPGIEISHFYDPMIAKVIAWGSTREEARLRLVKALSEFKINGIKTSIPLLIDILVTREFIEGKFDTQFLTEFLNKRKSPR